MEFAFTVDPDVTRARTLPSAFYLDPAFHALTRERVFARTWQWLGDLGDVAAPGSLSPREMLAGHLDEPLLLARDADGRAALPVERLHAPRQPPGARALPGRADPLRLPLAALRSRGPHDLHARLRAGAGLPRTLGPPAARTVRRVRRAGVRLARAGGAVRRLLRRHRARAWHGCRSTSFATIRRATAISSSPGTGPCTSRTTSRACTSPSSIPGLNQVLDMDNYRVPPRALQQPAARRGARRRRGVRAAAGLARPRPADRRLLLVGVSRT